MGADFVLANPTTCRFTGRSCITGSRITEVEIDVRQKVSIGFLRFALKNEAEIAGIISRQQQVHIISSVTGLMLPESSAFVLMFVSFFTLWGRAGHTRSTFVCSYCGLRPCSRSSDCRTHPGRHSCREEPKGVGKGASPGLYLACREEADMQGSAGS